MDDTMIPVQIFLLGVKHHLIYQKRKKNHILYENTRTRNKTYLEDKYLELRANSFQL